ncbi:MAG: DUF6198 family protein [Dysgonomonas sp.]
MNKGNDAVNRTVRKYVIFVASLFVMSIGVALTLRSDLGSSAISLLPYVWSLAQRVHIDIFGLTFTVPSWTIGQYTICMNTILILLQIVLLRRQFKKVQLLQMVTGFAFGVFIDLAMLLTSWCVWDNSAFGYILRIVQLFAACAILGFGIACEVRCNALLLPGEGFCVALSKVTGFDFGKAKIYNDVTLVAIGAAFTFLFFHTWKWNIVGVATLVSMVFVGVMVRFFSFRLNWLDIILNNSKESYLGEVAEEISDKNIFVITIGREFGSGGHEIGLKLSKQLGIAFYDNKIITETSEKLGLDPAFVKQIEQNVSTSKLLEHIITDRQVPAYVDLSDDDKVFITQCQIIRELASKQSCVIIGRAANYILKDHSNCLKLFIVSDIGFAKHRVMEEFKYDEEKAVREIQRVNQVRANHYWQYTGKKWNDAGQYDMVINSSSLGIDNSVSLIAEAVHSIRKTETTAKTKPNKKGVGAISN